MGATERMIASNALSLAFEILRTPFSKKKKTLVMTVNGERKDSKRFILNLGIDCPTGTIVDDNEDDPELEHEVEILEDYTDEEDNGDEEDDGDEKDDGDEEEEEGPVRKRPFNDDDGEDQRPSKAAKQGAGQKSGTKGKGKEKVDVTEMMEEHEVGDDDEMLLG